MKSVPVPAGNVKMRGKRCMTLSCGCCQAEDFRWRERWREAGLDISAITKGLDVNTPPAKPFISDETIADIRRVLEENRREEEGLSQRDCR